MQVFGFDAIQPYFALFFLIFVNLSFFKWIEKNRKEHKTHENKYRVKKLKAGQTLFVDDDTKLKVIPSVPSLGSLFSGSKQIGYMERHDEDAETNSQLEEIFRDKEMQEKKAKLRRFNSYTNDSEEANLLENNIDSANQTVQKSELLRVKSVDNRGDSKEVSFEVTSTPTPQQQHKIGHFQRKRTLIRTMSEVSSETSGSNFLMFDSLKLPSRPDEIIKTLA